MYAEAWTRVFNSIRNRIVITAADLDKNLKVRVIGNGAPVTRASGMTVLLFNTNVMLASELEAVVGLLKPEVFNAYAEGHTAEEVTQYLRDAQNLGNIPFSVPTTSRNIGEVGQGATADVTVARITIQSGERAGQETLALNFNRIIPAVAGTKATSAFDALMGDVTGVATPAAQPGADPFATGTARTAARGGRAAAQA